MQLNENKKHYIARIQQFTELNVNQQIYLIFDLMHEGQYGFTDTFAELLSSHNFHSNVQTIILEYLKKDNTRKKLTLANMRPILVFIRLNCQDLSTLLSHST